MLQHEGNHIGDTWYFVKDGICHCFYLTAPLAFERHSAWDIAHATSRDMVTWEKQGIILEHGVLGAWDEKCLATGSAIEYNDKFWIVYTGGWNTEEAAIGLAVSDDLYHWDKVSYNPILPEPEPKFANVGRGGRKFRHWRDAQLKVIDGEVYALVGANSKTSPPDKCGAVAICKTKDMREWTVEEELQISAVCQELECPQIYQIRNKYVLLFSCFYDLFSDEMKEQYKDKLRQTSYYMVSDKLWGPYQFVEDFELLPTDCKDSDRDLQYANQMVFMNDEWYIIGTVWSDAGDYIADPQKVDFVDGRLIRKEIAG